MLAVVWHYWIAVSLVVPAFLIAIVLVLVYLKVVVSPRYPKR